MPLLPWTGHLTIEWDNHVWTDVDAHTSRWDRHIRIHRGTHRKMGCNTDAVDTGRWGSETHTRQMVVAPRLVLMLPQRDNHVRIRTLTRAWTLTRADATRVDNSRTPAFSFQTQNTHELDCQTSHGWCFCGTIWLHADECSAGPCWQSCANDVNNWVAFACLKFIWAVHMPKDPRRSKRSSHVKTSLSSHLLPAPIPGSQILAPAWVSHLHARSHASVPIDRN